MLAESQKLKLTRKISISNPNILPWKVIFSDKASSENVFDYALNMRNYTKGRDVKIKSVVELRQSKEGGSTLEAVFDLEGTDLSYKTAGNLAIYAENSKEFVEKFAKILSLDLNAKFVIESNEEYTGKKERMPLPYGVYTIREALTKFIDLTSPLSKKTLKEFATKLESQKEREE